MSIIEKIIDYKDNEEDIRHWFKLKGEFRYERIIKFIEDKNISCTWKNVTCYIKYDKRLLINSFKYIVFLEEFYKSMIGKYKKMNVHYLIKMDFRKTINRYLAIGKKANFNKMDLPLLKEEKETIIQFRNSVVHNKILLVEKINNKTLEEVLSIIIKILPESYRNGFVTDINNCSIGLTEETWNIKMADCK